jgi:hypothetical protein
MTYNVPTFARAIAKIAYCHAVLLYGLEGLRPLWTRDLILGRYPYPLCLVGTNDGDPPPPSPQAPRHELWFGEAIIGRLTLEVASVRLFGDSTTREGVGMPIYHVVVGASGRSSARIERRVPVLPKIVAL